MSELRIDGHVISADMGDILNTIRREVVGTGRLRNIERRGDNYTVTCPAHKGGCESHPSCQVYCGSSPDIEYGTMHCFTCGENGSLAHFVGLCFEANDDFGRRWLLEHFGNNLFESSLVLTDIDVNRKTTASLDESVLDGLDDWHPYMEKRHLSRGLCKHFKVKYDPTDKTVVFPVWDENGRLVMLTRRSVEGKSFTIDKDAVKPVYLLNEVRKRGLNEVTVVESQINALTLWEHGIPAVALFGTGASHQYDILNKSPIRHYYLCFDGDNAGRNGADRFIRNIRGDVFVDVIVMPDGKDVNDLSSDEFDALPIMSSDEWSRSRSSKQNLQQRNNQ